MYKHWFIFCFFSCNTCWLFAQANYNFSFKVERAPSVWCKIGYYRGDETIVLDSIMMDSTKGEVAFNLKQKPHNGHYFFFMKGVGLMDFIINREYNQRFLTHRAGLMDSLRVEGSRENLAYKEYYNFIKAHQIESKKLKENFELLRKATKEKEDYTVIEKLIQQQQKKLDDYEDRFMERYPKLFVTQIVRARRIPLPPVGLNQATPEGKLNIPFFVWTNRHYWDNVDLTDKRLLYSRVISNKLQVYFEQFTSPRPDSIIQSIDLLLARCRTNDDMFKFVLSWVMHQADQRRSGGADNILVHLHDQYYSKDSTLVDVASMARLRYKADLYRPNLIGQLAPKIELPDTAGNKINLQQLDSKYTVVYFFSPMCSHCQEKTPIVAEATKPYLAKGLKVLAVTVDDQVDYWRKWVSKTDYGWLNVTCGNINTETQKLYAAYNLPVLYILDANKKIVGKNIKPEELGNLLLIAMRDKGK